MKVLVYGYGLMGKKVAHAVMNDADLELAGVVSPVFDVQPEVPAYKSLDEVQDDIDAIIDFLHPANLDSILSYALKNKCKVVFATTGFSAEDLKKIESELCFVLITSKAIVSDEEAPAEAFKSEVLDCAFSVEKSNAKKCERCWHYEESVDADPEFPGLCKRCVQNVKSTGEIRHFA